MNKLLVGRGWRQLVLVDLPPLAVSLAVADLFFKFGRFSLEAVGCLALWYALALCWRALLAPVERHLGITPRCRDEDWPGNHGVR